MSAPIFPAHPFSVKRSSVQLALGLSLLSLSGGSLPALAAPGGIDSVNDGQTINSGTYYNTPGAKTTFTNTNGTGLYLKAGDLVRGLESSSAGTPVPTGNGGVVHFNAPGQVVRLDGNVDISGIIKNGVYTGNGGTAFVDAGAYIQNGNIFANGANGGNVQFNVGSAMFGPNAQVQALGSSGLGGNIAVNASGGVDVRPGAVLDASGKTVYTYDRNLINIEGSFINNEGVIRANSVAINDGHIALINANGVAGATETANNANLTPASAPVDGFSRGGTIRLVATGLSNQPCFNCIINKGAATETNPFNQTIGQALLSPLEASSAITRYNFLTTNFDGDINNSGRVQASSNLVFNPQRNLFTGDNAGTVLLAAARNINNATSQSLIDATGISGGTIGLSARQNIVNNGLIQTHSDYDFGPGSQAGVIGISYGQAFTQGNTGILNTYSYNNSANKGLLVFSGPTNPTGGTTFAGTLVAPNLLSLNQSTYKGLVNYDTTRSDELLVRNENLLLLSNANGAGDLPGHISNALVRSSANPLGGPSAVNELTRGTFDAFTNLYVASNGTTPLRLTRPQFYQNLPLDTTNLNTFTANHGGTLYRLNQGHWYLGGHRDPSYNYFYSPLGGHYSLLAGGDIINTNSQVYTIGYLSGGSINLAAQGSILNQVNSDWQTQAIRQPNTFSNSGGNGALYGGSIIAKAANNVTNLNTSSITTNPIALLRNGPGAEPDAKFGGFIQIFAGGNFLNDSGSLIGAMSRVKNLPGDNIRAEGGTVDIKANNTLVNNANILATGESLLADGLTNKLDSIGQGGNILLQAGSLNILGGNGLLSAFGTTNGGQTSLTAGLLPNTLPGINSTEFASLRSGNNTAFVNGIANVPESVLIGGRIDNRGLNGLLGFTRFGGEQQVAFRNTANINNVLASNYLTGGNLNAAAFLAAAGNTQTLAGPGAVNAIACGGPLPAPTSTTGTPVGPGGLVTGPSAVGGTGNVITAPVTTPSLLGLFQNLRQLPIDRFSPNSSSRILLAFAQPNMFLARTYTPVTERILAAALEEYFAAQGTTSTLTTNTNGNNTSRAVNSAGAEQAERYLLQAGVDSEVARQLISQVDAGSLRADPIIVGILNRMASASPTPVESKKITQ